MSDETTRGLMGAAKRGSVWDTSSSLYHPRTIILCRPSHEQTSNETLSNITWYLMLDYLTLALSDATGVPRPEKLKSLAFGNWR